jgi:hypothetical protein
VERGLAPGDRGNNFEFSVATSPLKQILIIDGFKSIAEAVRIDNIKGFDVNRA